MKIVLSSRGSRGDVYPVIEIAVALHNAGHNVSICVPKLFEDYVRAKGIEPNVYTEDSELVMKNLASGLKAARNALDWFSRSIDEQFNYMLNETEDADILITSAAELIAPTIAEYRRIPYYRIAYTPLLPGYQPPPLFIWQKFPKIANRAMWGILNAFTGLFIRRFVNKKRKQLSMKPMGQVSDYFAKSGHTILTINSELAPPCPSWSEKFNYKYSYSGYCFGDTDEEFDSDLFDFIKKGHPPIYIGFGSVDVKNPDRFTKIILKAAEETDCRVVLGCGWTGLGDSDLPDNIYAVKDINHSVLFPLMAGVVHHGGSGTIHTAALSGVPQFIMPQIADQFYWGYRIYKLGLGPKPIAPKKITTEKLASTLNDFMGNNTYHQNARVLAEKIQLDRGVESVVEVVTASGESD